jgi:hypothetical protein
VGSRGQIAVCGGIAFTFVPVFRDAFVLLPMSCEALERFLSRYLFAAELHIQPSGIAGEKNLYQGTDLVQAPEICPEVSARAMAREFHGSCYWQAAGL